LRKATAFNQRCRRYKFYSIKITSQSTDELFLFSILWKLFARYQIIQKN